MSWKEDVIAFVKPGNLRLIGQDHNTSRIYYNSLKVKVCRVGTYNPGPMMASTWL